MNIVRVQQQLGELLLENLMLQDRVAQQDAQAVILVTQIETLTTQLVARPPPVCAHCRAELVDGN